MNFEQGLEIMASIVFYMYLIWVSRQDLKEMQVVRYSHILGVAAIFLQIVPKALQSDSRIYEAREYWVAVMVLLFLQMGACFLRMYGLADVFVCFLCDIFFLLEYGLEYYLPAHFLMQAIAGGLLLMVQLVKGNVKGTRLKRPVPYIPYLSVAFILTNMVL